MATMFARHRVKDFSAWKAIYDDFDAERTGMGVTGQGVYQLEGDPNDVTLYHHFASMEQAKDFAGSDRLREVMANAGVTGTPEIWFVEQA